MSSIFLAIFLMSATPAAPTFDAQTLDGRTLTGSVVELTTHRLVIAAEKGTEKGAEKKNVSLDTQMLLSIAANPRQKPLASASGVVVELTDGSIIRGRQYTARGKTAKIILADRQAIETPTDAVRTVQFGEFRQSHPAKAADSLDAEWARLVKMNADGDLLIVRADENLDYHKGVLHDVTDDVVRFELDGEALPVKRSKIVGFVYHHGSEPSWLSAACRITDATGSQWAASSLTLAEKLQWTTPSGLTVAEPLESVVEIDFSGGKLTYLGDLKPDAAVWTPYFGVEKPLPAAERFFAPRWNRGFEGAPLQLDGVVYGKGLAIHCRTELVYRLPDRFSRFQAIAGIDDAVRPNGKVRLTIRGGDKILLETTILGSDAPRPIDLDARNARRLTILVDFAGGFGPGDRLLLCNARILK